MSRNNIHKILTNRFYIGFFEWSGETYLGKHPLFIDPKIFQRVQETLTGHNRPKYSKRDIAFRGLMTCAHDGCTLTGDVQKQKYIYYRCTGNCGKCDLPRFKEEILSERLGEPLKGLQVPSEIVARIVAMLHEEQSQVENRLGKERVRLESRLTSIRNRMDSAYVDKLDGKIAEDFWERKMTEWRTEEQQVKLALDGLASSENTDRALDAQRVFELANKAYLLYVSQDSTENAKLLRMMCSNFSVDAVSATPTYRYPFDMIFKRAELEEWSGRFSEKIERTACDLANDSSGRCRRDDRGDRSSP
jgi:site-specific DNA recombinase